MDTSSGVNWRYMGLIVQQDHEETKDEYLSKLPSLMFGQIMEEMGLSSTFISLRFTITTACQTVRAAIIPGRSGGIILRLQGQNKGPGRSFQSLVRPCKS